MDAITLLGFYGLTRQEAALYLLLCAKGRLNGYEAAKLSGISRSNTYSALADLVGKGAAYMEEDTAVHYTPVPIEEFCNNHIRRMNEYRELLIKTLPLNIEDGEGYMTIKGETNIYDKMKNIIENANERIYIAVSDQIIKIFLQQLNDAAARGLKIVIITDSSPELEGALIYISKIEQYQIRIIADSKNVLTGDIAYGSESTCLYSQKRNLVELFKEALKNEITLLEIKKGAD